MVITLPSCRKSTPVTGTLTGSSPPSGLAVANRAANEQDIYATVFRYLFDHNASGQQKGSNVYCLSMGEKNVDPSDGFMRRFTGHEPPVRKASDCSVASFSQVVDRRTGKPGLMFRVTGIVWISSTEVTVYGGYEEANMSASGNSYTVKKENGKWKVTKEGIGWISQRLGSAVVARG
jgi:hypothetical protein